MNTLRIILFAILIISLGYVCTGYYGFARGVQNDAQRVQSFYKKNMFEAQFTGDILHKNYSKKCDSATNHLIEIVLSNENEKDFFTKFGFPPYTYILDLDKKLIKISVTPKIYERVNVGDKIIKIANSNNVLIDGTEYQLLSNDEFEWLVNTK
jgi:hypothetical protein